ncbi:RDD family protein [Spiroplasma endosymbiont of Asaphidion curtum]|uniref:RDD family protein n=1 Tax=Spiroplasma endosymbiont of Asaphidion curtum TaxID=3066281 RepID=UPI00313D5B78
MKKIFKEFYLINIMKIKTISSDKNTIRKKSQYLLVTLWKVIFARVIDYIIISMIIFIITWGIYQNQYLNDWQKAIINHLSALSLLMSYFVMMPYFCQGRTIAKFIFRFKLIKEGKKKIRIWDLLYRELFITIVPWVILIISNLFVSLVFKYPIFIFNYQNIFVITKSHHSLPLAVTITLRLMGLFYLLWYGSLMLLYKFDVKNQLFFDRYLQLYIVDVRYHQEKKQEKEKLQDNKIHIHLQDSLPGTIDSKELKAIEDL